MSAHFARDTYRKYITNIVDQVYNEVQTCIDKGHADIMFESQVVDWMMPFVDDEYRKMFYWPTGSLSMKMTTDVETTRNYITVSIDPIKILGMETPTDCQSQSDSFKESLGKCDDENNYNDPPNDPPNEQTGFNTCVPSINISEHNDDTHQSRTFDWEFHGN